MKSKELEWLYKELPELIAGGVITPECADAIRNYYGPGDKPGGSKTVLTVFGLIGGSLVGLGIILILAHNWDALSRMTRLAVAVGMLLFAQGLAGYALLRRRGSAGWTEGSAAFLMLMLGAAIALVGQTYQLVDDAGAFLLTWMALSAPLPYLLGATTPAVLYLAGITAWTFTGYSGGTEKLLVWGLLAVIGPYCWRLLKADRYANPAVILAWALTLCVYICFGTMLGKYGGRLSTADYGSLFAITYLAGVRWFDGAVRGWKKPFKFLGLAGGIGLSFLLTFRSFWQAEAARLNAAGAGEYVLALALLGAVIVLGRPFLRPWRGRTLLLGAAPLVIALGFFLLGLDPGGISPAILLNAYLLVLGVILIVSGVRQGSLGVLNLGMLLLAALIAARFFDISFSFAARGLVFVILGAGFLIANLIMVRRKSGVGEE